MGTLIQRSKTFQILFWMKILFKLKAYIFQDITTKRQKTAGKKDNF